MHSDLWERRRPELRTVSRKRTIFYNAVDYAAELGHLTGILIASMKWRAPKTTEAVNPRPPVVADGRIAEPQLVDRRPRSPWLRQQAPGRSRNMRTFGPLGHGARAPDTAAQDSAAVAQMALRLVTHRHVRTRANDQPRTCNGSIPAPE
jgi:hypothetical protein